jgi:ribonuclease BN (tRNA processing enzyme)
VEAVLLGSMGWVPRGDRMTTSVALRAEETLFLFDAGSGLARLLQPEMRRLVPERGSVHIFLSHLHLDHTVGLSFLSALWRDLDTWVHVPAESVTGRPVDILDTLIGPPFFPRTFPEFPMPVRLVPAEPGVSRIAGLEIRARRQEHPGGSLGYRVGDQFTLVTDSAFSPQTAEFAAGSRLLVHEAWVRDSNDVRLGDLGSAAHSTAEQAALCAQQAGVEELWLMHLNPLGDDAYYADLLARAQAIFPATRLGTDGLRRLL